MGGHAQVQRLAVVGEKQDQRVLLLPAAAQRIHEIDDLRRLAALARRRPTTVVERGVAAAASLLLAGGAAALRRGAGRAARSVLRSRPDFAPVLTALAAFASASLSSVRNICRSISDRICTVSFFWADATPAPMAMRAAINLVTMPPEEYPAGARACRA